MTNELQLDGEKIALQLKPEIGTLCTGGIEQGKGQKKGVLDKGTSLREIAQANTKDLNKMIYKSVHNIVSIFSSSKHPPSGPMLPIS